MTKQESFKRSVRSRMSRTGEKYGAARRALLQTSDAQRPSPAAWVEDPDTSDDAVHRATGRGWNEWCELIDAWPERTEGHAAMVARLQRDHLDNDGWWAQSVIVGYERIRGLRVKYMRADGTFAGSATRTLAAAPGVEHTGPARAADLRASLLDPKTQAEIVSGDFASSTCGPRQPVKAGLVVEQRSKSTSKAVRWNIQPNQGSVRFSVDARPDDRVRVSIQHEQLPSTEAVELWKEFWAAWLATLDESD